MEKWRKSVRTGAAHGPESGRTLALRQFSLPLHRTSRIGTVLEGGNPHCSCGSIMKKEFKPPVFSHLDFLKLDPPLVAAKKPNQD